MKAYAVTEIKRRGWKSSFPGESKVQSATHYPKKLLLKLTGRTRSSLFSWSGMGWLSRLLRNDKELHLIKHEFAPPIECPVVVFRYRKNGKGETLQSKAIKGDNKILSQDWKVIGLYIEKYNIIWQ